ncbi:Amino oxidase domain-containing protein [Citrus sinensis]|nr:Amino oxidase domain-containing protein [Citrus sinensis]
MRVAVIGAGISGLVSAYVLAKAGVEVVLYEKDDYLGGHAKTVTFDGVDLDLGFMVFNRVTYPNMMEFFESLGVDMEMSDMSFSVSLEKGHGCEWGSRNGLSSLFAQKKNVLNPYFWQMLREIIKFKDDVLGYLEELESNPDIDRSETLGQFVNSRGYSELFQKAYLIPICGSIWSCPSEGVTSFSAFSVLSFCRNHHLLQLFGRPQWLTVRWRSHSYVNKVRKQLESWGCQIRTSSEVCSVLPADKGCTIVCGDGSREFYNSCVMALHAPDALKILGNQATFDETRILGAFQYVYSDIFLHRDKRFMPQNPAAWSAWNFLESFDSKVCLTYWLNVLQNLGETSLPFLVTLNPDHVPEHTLLKWSTGHPVPSVAASKASLELDHIQGKRGIWFCGAYQGYGFHEDGLKAGMTAAHGVLGKSCTLSSNPRHMIPSLKETGARLFVARFLGQYISTGSMILLEEGGTIFTFEGTRKNCHLKTVLRIHSPQFYWKADLGLADAYINGDFSFVDKDEGLLNLFMILIANRDLDSSVSKLKQKRGWWSPMLFTAGIASAKYFFRHISRQNTLTQARRNISRHYDLSNELFSLFLDESMTYSCAVFKARVSKGQEVLEIGCGWGTLAIEIVKRTGCKYTGITLSEEQLKYAEMKVKEAGLQFISIPDERYNEYRLSSDFIKEYIFPGGCLPSLSRITSAMSVASRLCVEQVENIGIHYYQTLRCWRKNFMEKQSKILALGFNDKFIRTWEYYFDYCAAGFRSYTLGNYQLSVSLSLHIITSFADIPLNSTLYASNFNQSWPLPNSTFSLSLTKQTPLSFIPVITHSGGAPVSTAGKTPVDSSESFQFHPTGLIRLINGSGSVIWDTNTQRQCLFYLSS